MKRLALLFLIAFVFTVLGCSANPAGQNKTEAARELTAEQCSKVGMGMTLKEVEDVLGKGKPMTHEEFRTAFPGTNTLRNEYYQWGTPSKFLVFGFANGKVDELINLTGMELRD